MRRIPALLFALLLTDLPAFGQEGGRPAGDVRVALIAGDRTEALLNLATLAEARLSEGPGIAVLERRAVDRILDEQKLSVAGLVAADSAVAVGKLLPVDLFAVLGAGADRKEAAGLVVFDARTGVRLWDAALPAGPLDAAAAAVVEAVRGARAKARAARPARALCLATVRNADLPRDLDALCDSVGLLLERHLVASPDLALLERRRLEQVNRERDLPADSPLRPLLASVVTVSLDVARDGAGLRATALLADAKGADLGRATAAVGARDPEALAGALARETVRRLDARAGAAPSSPEREAARFLREAEFWWEHKDPTRALPAAESAAALRPDDPAARAALGRGLVLQAAEMLDPGGRKGVGAFVFKADPAVLEPSLELARRGADLLADLQPAPVSGPVAVHTMVGGSALIDYVQRTGALREGATPAAQQALAAVRAAQARAAARRLDRAAADVHDKASFDKYSEAFSGSLQSILNPGTPLPLRGDALERLRGWAEVARKHEDPRAAAGASLLGRALFVYRYPPPLDEAEAARQARVWADLAGHPNTVIAAYGRLGTVAVAFATGKLSADERHRRVRDFRLAVQQTLAQRAADPDAFRYSLYLAVKDGIDLLLNQPGYTEEITGLCDFMLGQNELAPTIAQMGGFHLLTRRTPEAARRAYELLRHALAIVDGEGRFLSFATTPAILQHDRDRMRVEYRRMQTELRQRFPDAFPPAAAPWTRAECLLDVKSNTQGLVWIQQPVAHEGAVLAAGVRYTPGREGIAGAPDGPPAHAVVLVRLTPGQPPREGRPLSVTLPFHPWAGSRDSRFRLNVSLGTAACVHQDRYWLGTHRHGLMAFPLDGGPPERLTAADGLPSECVQAVAGLGGTLYAWLGEPDRDSYLVAWDRGARRCTVLASSRRKDKASPFDDNSPLLCSAILPDPARGRLLLAAYSPWTWHPLNGVWALDGKTHALERLFPLHHSDIAQHHLFGPASRIDGNRLVMPTALGEFTHDLAKKDNRVTYGSQLLEIGPTKSPTYSVRLPPALQSWKGIHSQVRPPLAQAGGWIWFAQPFARRSLADGRQEDLASPRPGDPFFLPTECLRTFRSERELLAGDAFGLWLLTLPEGK